jgi:hypothetical protein
MPVISIRRSLAEPIRVGQPLVNSTVQERGRWDTIKRPYVECWHMPYQLRCDRCTLDQEFTDWADANRAASTHEADNPTHWVTILEGQPA